MIDCWIYQGKCLETPPNGFYGYVYCIYSLIDNRIYVGKKAFTHKSRRKLSKKDKLLPENKGKRVQIGLKDSGWLDYFGSSKELLEEIEKLGKENFKREILDFAKNKSELTLKEIEFQIKFNVLRIPSFNNWIGGKVYKRFL